MLLLVGVVSCGNKKGDDAKHRLDADSLMSQKVYVWPDTLEMVFAIPDSLRTTEQKELMISVLKIRYDYTEIENNYMVFKMSREEFLKTGIPEPYYHFLVSRTNQHNLFLYKWANMGDSVNDAWLRKKEAFRKALFEKENEENI